MSWDNGNGQGYPAYDPMEAALQRLDGATRTPTSREPYIGVGDQDLTIVKIEHFMHQTHGSSARAVFEVNSSASHAPGTRVAQTWNLVKPPPKPGMITDGERFADFVRKLRGAPDGTPMGPQIRTLLRDRVNEQVARGVRIKAFGVDKGKNGKSFVVPDWTHVEQTPAEIAQRRAAIEAKLGAPQAPQMQAVQVAPQQYQVQPQPPAHMPPTLQTAPSLLAQVPPENKTPGSW